MQKFAQIVNDQVHWLFESNEKPDFSPDIEIVDVTHVKDIQEGYFYDREKNKFYLVEAQIVPSPKTETVEDKLNRLETHIKSDNLITFDVLATLHEEISSLRSEIATLKGATSND